MKSIPLNNYLETLAKVGRILQADEIAPIARRPSYDNYNYASRKKSQQQPYQYGQNEGKIYAHGGRKASYGKFASALLYTILPYDFNGMTEQLVPLEEELRGQTWINTLSDKKAEFNNDMSGRRLKAVRIHESRHQKDPGADEITNRKNTQQELLTEFGTLDGTYHEARYA